MKPIGLLRSSLSVSHVSGYALESLECAVAAHGWRTHRPLAVNRSAGRLVKFFYKTGVLRGVKRRHGRALLVPMMGLQESLLFPWAFTHEIIPVVFDCMPHQFHDWYTLFRRNRIATAFFTASAVVEHFRAVMPHGHWHWLPEAIDIDIYSPVRPWATRTIDVLEFGRRFGTYHEAVTAGLRDAAVMHIFERTRGELVFPTREEFITGLAGCKVSICFPQSQTHPERFGHIETLTQRYLESLASGAVIVGAAPAELRSLFGYDPVIPVDWDRPVEQLLSIVREPQRHEAVRNRNLEAVRRGGCWRSRGIQLVSTLRTLGYGNPSPQSVTSRGVMDVPEDPLGS